MPRIKTMRTKTPPKGWETIEPTLKELYAKLRELENSPPIGKRKPESLWPIMKVNHQISRYIYVKHYVEKTISKDLFEYCVREKWIDNNLVGKWRKPGYEKVCCLMCLQPTNHNFGTTCICRVPKKDLAVGKLIECQHCGCRGCASCD